jgi:hypothetical protein
MQVISIKCTLVGWHSQEFKQVQGARTPALYTDLCHLNRDGVFQLCTNSK